MKNNFYLKMYTYKCFKLYIMFYGYVYRTRLNEGYSNAESPKFGGSNTFKK